MFDYKLLYSCLNANRIAREVSWRGYAKLAGMSSSTFTRIKEGSSVRTDTLYRILEFAGVKFEDFTRRGKR